MTEILKSLIGGGEVDPATAESIMQGFIAGKIAPEIMGSVLTIMHFRPPTGKMLAGFARAFRRHAIAVPMDPLTFPHTIDVCGTGGDGHGTFNISTTVAFVAAAGGAVIAKHGNRAVSSRCGSFDVLETLGVPFADTPAEAVQFLRRDRLAFMYAPSFHPTFRRLAPLRKALGFRTVLNALGPLLNPAGVFRQLIGVYSRDLVVPVAEALRELGSTDALVVCGEDGSDEISLCAPTLVAHLKHGNVTVSTLHPEHFGFRIVEPRLLLGGDARQNAQALTQILSGETGPRRDIVVLNSGAALFVSGQVESIEAGVKLAEATLDSKGALRLLNQMRATIPVGAAI